MQTVPSLVGSGTAIATAATGFILAEEIDANDFFFPNPPLSPDVSAAAPAAFDHRSPYSYQTLHPPSRPSTSLANFTDIQSSQHRNTVSNATPVSRPPLSRYQRPKSSQFLSARLPSRRQSLSKFDEPAVSPAAADAVPRTSISSTGSWVRRLSLRPQSQHGSIQSSVGPDSIAFSHNSGAPILSRRRSVAPGPAPNKLVKRTPSTPGDNHRDTPNARPSTRSHLPSLRRPATSHQRTATLQRLQDPLYSPVSPTTPATPYEGDAAASDAAAHGLLPSALDKNTGTRTRRQQWSSFFHSRVTSTGQSADIDSQQQSRHAVPKRLRVFARHPQQRPYLVKPQCLSSGFNGYTPPPTSQATHPPQEATAQTPRQTDEKAQTPQHRARRSLSMSFSSATDWMARTSGSLRRPKRGDSRPTSPRPLSRHVVSDPITPKTLQPEPIGFNTPRAVSSPLDPAAAADPITAAVPPSSSSSRKQPRRKQSSSPLRPLSSRSNNGDLVRPKSSGGMNAFGLRQNQPSGSSTSSAAVSSHARSHRRERSSTLDGSESELRDFTSGDEDTDFRSDTLFDSLRTGASGRVRTVETPLDSMYDESPPSTAGHGRSKRLSIQEMLGKDWNDDDRILEEDESAHTPVRLAQRGAAKDNNHLAVPTDEPRLSTDSGRLGRFSMDDEFDEDWDQDEDDFPNALSPPSRGSMVNLGGGINPNVRMSMASGISIADSAQDQRSERPLSSLFDWSEPPAPEPTTGHSTRPKTSYANQDGDTRGGRSVNRKGPTPAHVRSQSVPVVHDGPEESTKPAGAKYGTWGIGAKTISEDWGDDFEFGGDVDSDDKDDDGVLFAVPESIQASQPSVRAHSGQIRELSLLVNDLQRLCRHGRDLDLLHGPQIDLWEEAEGIIALASPDDDSLESDHETTSSIDMDAFDDAHERLPPTDDGLDFDSASLDKLDAALDGREPAMSKTAVVRDRPSPRRRSVFSPDDDIFGGGSLPASEEGNNYLSSSRISRPRTPESRLNKSTPPDVNGVVRSVVEVMQQQRINSPSNADNSYKARKGHARYNSYSYNGNSYAHGSNGSKKMHFDTNSLRTLVKRAGDLRDMLSESVRRADQITQSPMHTPRHQRYKHERNDSSPAFTRVFDDPAGNTVGDAASNNSSPRRKIRSRGNTVTAAAMADGAANGSPDTSPSGIGRRMHMMTVQ